MPRISTIVAAVALSLAIVAMSYAKEPSLKIGDPAPPLAGGQFVKGEPVKSFEPGKVYVVEFWATWCGPCKQSIPHISALAAKYKDKGVIVIGQDVWEEDQAQVAGFVQEMGEKMDYRVALDDVSGGGKGRMSDTWMQAAGQEGIPTAFIVDRAGKIAWIGHPMQMDRPLDQIVEGTFDVAKEAQLAASRDAADAKLRAAMKSGDKQKVLAAIDEISADATPEMASGLAMMKFGVLLDLKEYDAAYAQADKAAKLMDDDAESLNQIAWTIVDKPGLEKRDLDLAQRIATRANELTGNKRGDIIDTLARVHFEKGDIDKAIELQTEAVAKSPDAGMRKQLEATLEKYKAAKK